MTVLRILVTTRTREELEELRKDPDWCETAGCCCSDYAVLREKAEELAAKLEAVREASKANHDLLWEERNRRLELERMNDDLEVRIAAYDKLPVMLRNRALERMNEALRRSNKAKDERLDEYREVMSCNNRALLEALALLRPADCKGWDVNWCPTSCSVWKVCLNMRELD